MFFEVSNNHNSKLVSKNGKLLLVSNTFSVIIVVFLCFED